MFPHKSHRHRLLSVVLFGIFCTNLMFAQITVSPNVQVSSTNADRAHCEVMVAADPENPNHLLGCSIIEANQPSTQVWHTIAYRSIDGGSSWQPTLEIDRGFSGSSDPACTFGIDGRAYFAAVISERSVEGWWKYHTNRTAVYLSPDGGKTWQPPFDSPWVDREFISVDTSRSKYRGHIYMNGTGFARSAGQGPTIVGFAYFRSLDEGKTFSHPYLLAPAASRFFGGQTQSAVLSDGMVIAAFTEQGIESSSAAINVVTSSDGGETFSHAVTVQSEVHLCGGAMPSLEADHSAGTFRNYLYLTWTDSRFGRCDVLMSRSSDKGKTWSQPVIVNDDPPSKLANRPAEPGDHMMSMVAVNTEGVVGVMWYDPYDSNDPYGYSVRFSASMDGGETFLPSVRVSDRLASYEASKWQLTAMSHGGGHSDPNDAGDNLRGTLTVNLWPGHTVGMASSADGTFHPLWVDNRTAITQVWTATIRVQGKAFPNGASELANLQDLTPKLMLQLSRPRFDAVRKIATVDAYLVNTSKSSIQGPMKLRFLSMSSQMGIVRLIGSANSLDGPGAILDIARQIPNETLDPGARTDAIHIEFSVPDPRLLPVAHPEVVQFEAKVLGGLNANHHSHLQNETEVDTFSSPGR